MRALSGLPVPLGHLPWIASVVTTLAAAPAARRRRWARALVALAGPMAVTGVVDLVQTEHAIRRNFPGIGHLRYLLEDIRPEIRQYFIESDTEETPFSRDERSLVYARAKGELQSSPFGTELDLYADGAEWVEHSLAARVAPDVEPRVRVGGPACTQPWEASLLNVSAMSFGSLSANAVAALNLGAARGGFAQSTGEGGLTEHHLRHGGDLIWQIGTGYFGCRTTDGRFDPAAFTATATRPEVRAITIKLSQGAKPGKGGVMPGVKVSPEIARIRGVPVGRTIISPPAHTAFTSPEGLIAFVADLRARSGGKPVGIKLCVGARHEFLAICRAAVEAGDAPDYVLVDGAEGGTGAAPLEFSDHVGTPLTEGLAFVHNALVGTGLRDVVRVGAAGKVASGFDIVKRICQGADFTMAARAMMFAVGCIQAEECHANTCPVGVATQDPRLVRGLDVPSKGERARRFHHDTVHAALSLIAAMGLEHPGELRPHMLLRRVDQTRVAAFDELHPPLQPGELLGDAVPSAWARHWQRADPTTWAVRTG